MADSRKTFGVAVFGLGRAGTIHFKNIVQRPRLHLKYVVDVFPDRCAKLLEDNFMTDKTQVCSYDDSQKVFDDETVSFVVVTTPTDQHEEIVHRALDAGKAVFCEKPIAKNHDAADKLFEKAESLNLPLYCAFQRRFDPSMARIRQEAQKGDLGEIHMITTYSRDSPLPSMDYLKISGGIFHDCAVHDLDMVCWIANEKPNSVFVSAAARHPEIKAIGDVDTVAITLSFSSGIIGTIHISRHSTYHYDQRVEVHGSLGMRQCINPPADSVLSFGNKATEMSLPPFSFPQRYIVAYAAELDHFIQALSGEVPLLVKREEVHLVSALATACEKSLELNQRVPFPVPQ